MPALHIFGARWNTSTDHFALYALILLVYHFIWIMLFWIGIAAFTAPSRCPDGPTNPQEYTATYIQGAIYWFWLGLSALMLWISLRGAPFEPSKRRWLPALIYTYVLSWIPAVGILAYSIYVIYGVDDTCWASGSKSMIALETFGALGIMAGIAFTLVTTHPLFGEVRPEVKWHVLKKGISTCVGFYTWLLHRHRGPVPPLEELATEYLDLHGNTLDLDKSDVVAALACARLVQRERREGLMRARLQAAGELSASTTPEGGVEQPTASHQPQGSSAATDAATAAAPTAAADAAGTAADAAAAATAAENGQGQGGESEELQEWIAAVSRGSGVCLTPSSLALHLAPHLSAKEAARICTDSDGPTDQATLEECMRWARYAAAAYGQLGYMWTAEGQSARAARKRFSQLAQQAQQAGKVPAWHCSGDSGSGSSGVRSASLPGATATAANGNGEPKVPAAGPTVKQARDYVAARELLGLEDGDILSMAQGDEEQGQLAHFVALDRPRQCVVVAVSGQRRYVRMADAPTELPQDWAPPQNAGAGAMSPHAVHAGALAAAQHLLADLDAHGVLSTLLPPASPEATACAAAPALQHMAAAPEARPTAGLDVEGPAGAEGSSTAVVAAGAEAASGRTGCRITAGAAASPTKRASASNRVAAEEGPFAPAIPTLPNINGTGGSGSSNNSSSSGVLPAAAVAGEAINTGQSSASCASWDLVLTGHGQGAGAAVLLGLKLEQRYPGRVRVWAFSPPGGLCDAPLSAALAPNTVAVMVGKDAVPRTSAGTVAGLVEEGLVGLARLRYNKSLLFLATLVEKLGPRCLRGKWVTPGRALHPAGNVPPEALGYLSRFHAEQQEQQKLGAAQAPPTTLLPGRVLYLRRLKPLPQPPPGRGTAQQAQQVQTGDSGSAAVAAAASEAGRMEAGATAPRPGSGQGCCGGCCGSSSGGRRASAKSWDAVWVAPGAAAEEGIPVSKRSVHDHYVSRLLSALQRAAAAAEGGSA